LGIDGKSVAQTSVALFEVEGWDPTAARGLIQHRKVPAWRECALEACQ
jgi:hypothetical protein